MFKHLLEGFLEGFTSMGNMICPGISNSEYKRKINPRKIKYTSPDNSFMYTYKGSANKHD